MSFLTAGETEVRAWTIPMNSTAPKAAGAIHSDFEKKFIRAEVVNWKALIDHNGYPGVREKGLLRLEGKDIPTATLEASLLRLRPIMMTALVACFGLLPAAMSTGIGSDSQKPFAIVIVAGLASRLFLSIFLSPVLYALAAREGDVLQV